MYVTLTPAYGRDYKSAKAALVDYNADKDFIIETFGFPRKPINKSQCEAENMQVTLRYNNLRNTRLIT